MENFVPFETAKKLKEKGFREKCYRHYYPDSKDWFLSSSPECDNYSGYLDIPTISQVLKWLREDKDLFIQIMFIDKSSYYYEVIDIATDKVKCSVGDYKDSPELAALAGVEYVVDNLI